MKLPAWLLEKLASPPVAGAGVHGWLFSVARQLHAHLGEGEIVACLTAATAACGRYVTAREIADAARNSREVAWTPKGGSRSTGETFRAPEIAERAEKWPMFSGSARNARIADVLGDGFDGFTRDEQDDCDDVIDDLFPGAEWLCLAKGHPATARSRRREKWLFESSSCDLVVPSPMTGPSGKRQDGKVSHRCLENTASRRWLVIEFDDGTMREQGALHWHFSEQARANGWPELRLAVFSGMKSLHGWYGPVTDEDIAKTLMSYAVLHGADPSTWTRCQLVRLPGGLREIPLTKVNAPEWAADFWPDGFTERQRILYYEH